MPKTLFSKSVDLVYLGKSLLNLTIVLFYYCDRYNIYNGFETPRTLCIGTAFLKLGLMEP